MLIPPQVIFMFFENKFKEVMLSNSSFSGHSYKLGNHTAAFPSVENGAVEIKA